ncbi:restriction endonuclease subunit S [Burkholderia pseudomallei]|uniref:restriction endonuclease subunit S n=1 Tax=Burkholderia pseudomallei TaxID=28450 RepID=UPI00050D9D60|nr:restriction endonuclease subunit S [Burkholderia pseudomallei]KGC43708.1 type I restriction modification DNA specificity domain protein [Burkholderia pseudomallei]
MSHYKPYPTYKDSGVKWLGQVPEHWAVKQIKYLASHIGSGKTPTGGAEVYEDSGVLFLRSQNVYESGLKLEDVAFITDEVDEEMKGSRVKPGDVLLNITGASIGRSCLVPNVFERANVNQHVCIIRSERPSIAKWMALCLPSRTIQAQIDFSQNGAGREGLNFEQIGKMLVALPPVSEIDEISGLIDRETARIDALVEKKTRFIELLREKRHVAIAHAVTKGLDSSVPMRDSGVEWLGEVPQDWVVTKIKRIILTISQGWSPECDPRVPEPDEWGVLKVGCVNGGEFQAAESKTLPENLEPRPELALRKGDVLVSRANTRELVGGCAVVEKDYPKLMVCDKLYRLLSNPKKVIPGFLAKLIAVHGRRAVEVEANGASSSMVNISQSVILDLMVAMPSLSEQKKILAKIDKVTSRIDLVITQTVRSIELLKERRSALITAAVTGQIDLRDTTVAAASQIELRETA